MNIFVFFDWVCILSVRIIYCIGKFVYNNIKFLLFVMKHHINTQLTLEKQVASRVPINGLIEIATKCYDHKSITLK